MDGGKEPQGDSIQESGVLHRPRSNLFGDTIHEKRADAATVWTLVLLDPRTVHALLYTALLYLPDPQSLWHSANRKADAPRRGEIREQENDWALEDQI